MAQAHVGDPWWDGCDPWNRASGRTRPAPNAARASTDLWSIYRKPHFQQAEQEQHPHPPMPLQQEQTQKPALLTVRGAVLVIHDRQLAMELIQPVRDALAANVEIASPPGMGWRSKLVQKKLQRDCGHDGVPSSGGLGSSLPAMSEDEVQTEAHSRLAALAPAILAQVLASSAAGVSVRSSAGLILAHDHVRASVAKHNFQCGKPFNDMTNADVRRAQRGYRKGAAVDELHDYVLHVEAKLVEPPVAPVVPAESDAADMEGAGPPGRVLEGQQHDQQVVQHGDVAVDELHMEAMLVEPPVAPVVPVVHADFETLAVAATAASELPSEATEELLSSLSALQEASSAEMLMFLTEKPLASSVELSKFSEDFIVAEPAAEPTSNNEAAKQPKQLFEQSTSLDSASSKVSCAVRPKDHQLHIEGMIARLDHDLVDHAQRMLDCDFGIEFLDSPTFVFPSYLGPMTVGDVQTFFKEVHAVADSLLCVTRQYLSRFCCSGVGGRDAPTPKEIRSNAKYLDRSLRKGRLKLVDLINVAEAATCSRCPPLSIEPVKSRISLKDVSKR
jgi:hypothetical protein